VVLLCDFFGTEGYLEVKEEVGRLLRAEKKRILCRILSDFENRFFDRPRLVLAPFGHHHWIAMGSMIGKASQWRLVGLTLEVSVNPNESTGEL